MRRAIGLLLFTPALLWCADAIPKDGVPVPMALFNFDRDALGKLPQGFTPAVSGEGPGIRWEVRQDSGAPSKPNVLAQIGKAAPGENAAILLLDNFMLDHGEIAVRFKTLAGEDDQASGIVVRYKDPRNFYVILASSRDDNCALYRVKKGKWKQLDSKNNIVTPYLWHELRITFAKGNYTALIDGELVLGGKDSSFKDPGLVGLATLSDSVIAFDDLRVSK